MCGIVFAGGLLGSNDLDVFNQLLYCDVFRGVHSTGVMCKRVLDKEVKFFKAAVPSAPFLGMDGYKAISEGETKYVVAPTWLVGHNRHATRGAVNAENAHPFHHGAITLVHNGTLVDQGLLPDSSRFVVDSENICHSINKIGAAETIQRLDGAFTLIWHDANDDTLHIIRNSERPFHLARVGQDWFGASEEDMLLWILKRNKSIKNRISEHFECEVGVEYVFDVSGTSKKCQLKEQIKHTLPTFTYASRYRNSYSGTGWQQDYSRNDHYSNASQSREASKKAERDRQNGVAEAAGIKARIDSRVTMIPHTWFPYSASSVVNKGRITGYIYDDGEYYEVDVHNADKAMYEDCMDDSKMCITGTVTAINKVKDTVRLIMTGPSLIRPDITPVDNTKALPNPDSKPWNEDEDVPFGNVPDSFTMPNGRVMTLAMWNKHDHSVCGGCGKHILWKDAQKAEFAYQCFWHPSCLTECMTAAETAEKQQSDDNDQFLCAICGKEKPMKVLDSVMSSERMDDICTDCATIIREKIQANKPAPQEILCDVIDKTNGNEYCKMSFTKAQFERMIKMRGSESIEFKDLAKAHIEKRGSDAFAYKYGDVKEEDNAAKAATFSRDSRSVNKSLSKVLRNGQSELQVTKAYWTQIGQCHNCYTQIPWRDVEDCVLTLSNRIVCPTCRGE